MSSKVCPECGKPLGSAGDFLAMLLVLAGFPAWLFLLYGGLVRLKEGRPAAGWIMLALGVLILGGSVAWLFTRRSIDAAMRERDRRD